MANPNDPTHPCCGFPALPNDWIAVCNTCRLLGCQRCMLGGGLEWHHRKCVTEIELMTDPKSCTKCGGAGVLEDRNNEHCNRCGGTGKEPSPPMNEG